ncbi:MAG: hypothetical protein ACXVJ5_03605 [Flavisolibacter sp.]
MLEFGPNIYKQEKGQKGANYQAISNRRKVESAGKIMTAKSPSD